MKSQTIINIAFAASFAGWVVWSRNPSVDTITCKELRVVDSAKNTRISLEVYKQESANIYLFSEGDPYKTLVSGLNISLGKDRVPDISFTQNQNFNELSGTVQFVKTFDVNATGWSEKFIAAYTRRQQEQQQNNKEFK